MDRLDLHSAIGGNARERCRFRRVLGRSTAECTPDPLLPGSLDVSIADAGRSARPGHHPRDTRAHESRLQTQLPGRRGSCSARVHEPYGSTSERGRAC
jgi:hypothetical protein